MSKTQESILDLIKKDKKITQKKIAEKLGVTNRAVRKAMVSLIENNIIKREGSSRNGSWVIVIK